MTDIRPARLLQQNAVGHVQKLPNELLVNIFKLTQRSPTPDRSDRPRQAYPWHRPEDDKDYYYWAGGARWTSLMLVCRFWREVIVQSPCLWQSVDIQKDIRWLELVLSRSRSAPLELYFHHLDTARAVVPIILPHAHRLRKLVLPPLDERSRETYIRTHADVTHFRGLLCTTMPLLDELMLSVELYDHAREVDRTKIDWSKTRHPRLRILRVACMRIPWNAELLHGLTCLDLRTCTPGGTPLSCDQFLDVLERCSALEELRLLDRFISATLKPSVVEEIITDSPGRTLQLPVLRKLVLADYPAITTWLLSRFAFTGQVSIIVVGWLQSNVELAELDHTFSSLIPRHAIRKHFFPAARPTHARITIREGEEALRVWSDGGAELLLQLQTLRRLGDEEMPLRKGIREFIRIFGNFPIKDLFIDADLEGAQSRQCWTDLLESLPKLEELEIIGRNSIVPLMRALKYTPLTGGDAQIAPKPPPCPRLCRLCFEYPDYVVGDIELMVSVFNRRAHFDLAPMENLEFYMSCHRRGDEWGDEETFNAEVTTYLSELEELCSQCVAYHVTG